MEKKLIYKIVFYGFFLLKLFFLLFQVEFFILKQNFVFPQIENLKFYEG